ncbi:hypothetical protein [Treponema putidum]|uniref:Uncharacterized protein n=1 Tax=Treponema putidum TaxID=221027 RepID=A0AAE9MS84_9SPIR|nr:hypothetical protein [Treponema putidum]UTY33129.1 hypothetical protein E4N74_03190 [Treponema putidum]
MQQLAIMAQCGFLGVQPLSGILAAKADRMSACISYSFSISSSGRPVISLIKAMSKFFSFISLAVFRFVNYS